VTQETTGPMSQEKETKLLNHIESADNISGDATQTSQFTSSVSEELTIHELKNLMERPTLIRTAQIETDKSSCVFSYNREQFLNIKQNITTLPGLVDYINYPQDIITKNPVVAAKIAQFAYFKADMKLEIKINKSPEVTGCLMAVYFPTIENLEIDASNLTLQGLTSYPYEILDYSTDTSLTMTVPYINQYDYFNFQQANGSTNPAQNYGTIALFNLQAPISGTSNPKVSYALFGSFEHMELKLPTQDPGTTRFMAQSGVVERIPGSDIMSDDQKECTLSLNYNTQKIDNSKILYESNETSLKHVLSRENIIGRLEYTAGKNANSSSFMGKVRCFPKRPPKKSIGNLDVTDPSRGNAASLLSKPIQMGTFDYTSNLFGRYTGTVEIGIRLLKTKFHYGRIAVVFDPFDRCGDELGSLLSTNYSMIIDLNAEDGMEGSSNYYRISVPYMNNVGHSVIGNDFGLPNLDIKCAMVNSTYGIDTRTSGIREVYNPYLRFYALTELGYLEAAANVVPILVSIRAGADYKLSIPTVNVAKVDPPAVSDDKFYCQSGLIELVPETSRNSRNNIQTSVGEEIMDLKQLTSRYTPINVNVIKSPAFFEFGSGVFVTSSGDGAGAIGPGKGPAYYNRSTAPGGVSLSLSRNTVDGHRLSNVEAVGLLYRFMYGGRNYKCTATERGSTMLARLIHSPLFSGDIASFGENNPANRIVTDEFSTPTTNKTQVQHGYAVSPVTGVTRALNGQMVVNTSINNYLEISRNFYSNRKLISTERVAGRREAFSDDIITQIVSFSPEKTRSIELSDNVLYVKVGPHVKKGNIQDWKKVGNKDPSDEDWADFEGLNWLFSPADLETDDGMYYVSNAEIGPGWLDGTLPKLDKLECAEINNSNVLESLPSTGGYTFLKGPPCVIFM